MFYVLVLNLNHCNRVRGFNIMVNPIDSRGIKIQTYFEFNNSLRFHKFKLHELPLYM